jgi:chromosomal replication initiator protein
MVAETACCGEDKKGALRLFRSVVVSQWTAGTVWDEACKRLKALLHPDVYTKWIGVIKGEALDDTTLTLCVNDDFYQSWLEEHYLPFIKQSVQLAYGGELDIRFIVREEAPQAPADPLASLKPVQPDTLFPLEPFQPAPRAKHRSKDKEKTDAAEVPLNHNFTFDSFVVGPSNSFAHAACMAVAQAPAKAYNPLFIYGGVGLGKTHLMQAIGNYMQTHGKSAKVCYVSSESFINEYIDSLQNNKSIQFRRKYRNMDLLLIDDIQFLAGKERLQEEFFHTFNALFQSHKQIVLTSDRPASQIQGLEQRLVSRFEWGLVTELQAPDYETRLAILRNKQDQAVFKLPEEVICFIAEHIKSNIRRLEGALIRVTSYASLYNEVLSLARVEELLRDTLEVEHQQALTMDGIQKAVAEYFDVRMADMSSKRRPQAVAQPRQVAMYLCRRLTSASSPEVATAFGKTHATILHACTQIEKKMASDESLKQGVLEITRRLGRKLPIH